MSIFYFVAIFLRFSPCVSSDFFIFFCRLLVSKVFNNFSKQTYSISLEAGEDLCHHGSHDAQGPNAD